MSKKAKKKKKKAEYPTKEEKAQRKKRDRILAVILLCEIAFGFIYILINKVYADKSFPESVLIFRQIKAEPYVILCIILLMTATSMFSNKGRVRQKVIALTLTAIIGLSVCFMINCNIWSAETDGLHYSTLFTKDKSVYGYDELESITLYESGPVSLHYGESRLTYEIQPKNGKVFRLYLSNAAYDNAENVIRFDKELLPEKTTSGNYNGIYRLNDEALDKYYKSVFAES